MPAVVHIPKSLVWATDLDVLPIDRVITRREGYVVVRSPSNPRHYWGNLLLFDDPPATGDGSRWEQLFGAEFGADPRVRHQTFAWDRVDGALGSAREELVARGYGLEQSVGLVAGAGDVRPHARENRQVHVRALSSDPGRDQRLWDEVVELQVVGRDQRFEEVSHRAFTRARLADLRALFRGGRGAWYVAIDPSAGEVVASCGVVVTGTRARFQTVDTAAPHRRRGICSRLVVEAARRTVAEYGARSLVIAADAHYHALGLYESLGFRRAELVCGTCRQPE